MFLDEALQRDLRDLEGHRIRSVQNPGLATCQPLKAKTERIAFARRVRAGNAPLKRGRSP